MIEMNASQKHYIETCRINGVEPSEMSISNLATVAPCKGCEATSVVDADGFCSECLAAQAQDLADEAAINCQRCGAMLTTANSGTETADGGMRLDVEMCNDCERISEMCERVLASAEAEWAKQEAMPLCEVCDTPGQHGKARENPSVVACDSCWDNRPGHGDLAGEDDVVIADHFVSAPGADEATFTFLIERGSTLPIKKES